MSINTHKPGISSSCAFRRRGDVGDVLSVNVLKERVHAHFTVHQTHSSTGTVGQGIALRAQNEGVGTVGCGLSLKRSLRVNIFLP